jgi:DNA-binding NtrC family response regulator
MKAIVLCVDVAENRLALDRAVRESGHVPMYACSRSDLAATLDRGLVDLVVAPDGPTVAKVFDALGRFAPPDALPPVIVLRHHAEAPGAMVPEGAFDVLTTPIRREAVGLAITAALERRTRQRETADHREAHEAGDRESFLVGQGTASRLLFRRIATAANQDRPVLIVGEVGVGKGLVARAVHERSARRDRPLAVVACGAHATPVLEELLFGAASPGGEQPRVGGALRRAGLGSLVLQRIPELDATLQYRLLDELASTGEPSPESPAQVRVLATCESGAETSSGEHWRETPLGRELDFDLIQVPPLRERIEDLPMLVGHFVSRAAHRLGVRPPEVLPEGLARLARRAWPGNVRELENVVERALIMRRSGPLDADAFAAAGRGSDWDGGGRAGTLNLSHLERLAIRAALSDTQGHQGRAARLLGISPRTLRRRLRELESAEQAGATLQRPASAGAGEQAGDHSFGATEPAGLGSGRRGLRSDSSEEAVGDRERARPDATLAIDQDKPRPRRTPREGEER